GWVRDFSLPDMQRLVLRLAKYSIGTLSETKKLELKNSMYSEINNICRKINQHGFNASPEHDPRIFQLWLTEQMESAWKSIENQQQRPPEHEDEKLEEYPQSTLPEV